MGEFEEKLNAILSNPEAMAQVASLAQSLGMGNSVGGTSPQEPAPEEKSAAENRSSTPGQVDAELFSKLSSLISGDTGAEDQRLALLQALAPFLRPERREKIQRAVSTARLLRLGRQLLTNLGGGNV